MTTTRTGTNWLATADPSWYPHVLTILQRDYPDAADMAWSTAISENAEAQIERYGSTGRTIGQALANPARSAIGGTRACPDCGRPQHYTGTAMDGVVAAEEAFADLMFRADPSIAPRIGATRLCPQPDCGRPQHYTGTEAGWCHDTAIDMWDCADPRKAGA